MLVLTRRVGESILIELPSGEQVSVTVLGTKGSQVRLARMHRMTSRSCVKNCWKVYKSSPEDLQICIKKPAPVVAQDAGSLLASLNECSQQHTERCIHALW